MIDPRRVLAASLGVVAVCVTVLVARAAWQAEAPESIRSPRLAVVLVPGASASELVVIDTDAGSVVRRVRLRSLVTDVDVDPERGMVVAAQTGGIGDLADNAVSFTDPRTGSVGYVTLPTIDPSQVRCVAGRALVMHSVVDARGFVVTALDLASRRVVATGHTPDGTGLWAGAGNAVWTAVAGASAGEVAPARVDPRSLESTRLPEVGFTPSAIVPTRAGVAVLGTAQGSAAAGMIALTDPVTGRVRMRGHIAGLPHGAQCGVEVGSSLVVGDWNGSAPESAALAVLDAATLARRGTISVGTAPCALAAMGDELLVVDRVEGALRVVDVRTGAVRRRVDLGVRGLLCSRVVAVPSP